MGIFSNMVVAFSMSTDAFAASIAKGVKMKSPGLKQALPVALLFGTVETVTPLIGWLIGSAATGYIESVDHWVIFAILAFIGGHMISEGLSKKTPEGDVSEEPLSKCIIKKRTLFLTALATSLDAMALGVSIAFMNMNIIITALMVGAATFTMVLIGLLSGKYIGAIAGRLAEVFGGICLILIGTKILLEHLGIFSF